MTWRLVWAVSMLAGVVAVGACAGTDGATEPDLQPSPTAATTASSDVTPSIEPSSPTATPQPSQPPTPSPTPPSSPTPPPPPSPPDPAADGILEPGERGAAVAAMQQRLTDLGYWLGSVDGVYGPLTAHAVTALQKTAGMERTGVADGAAQAALEAGVRPETRGVGVGVEIDVSRQVLLVVRDGRVAWILDTSTGRAGFDTPTGRFSVVREVDAPDVDDAYRPKFFSEVGDLSIHGFGSVPPYPASHGCARVTIAAMDWLWASGLLPLGAPVLIY